MVVRTDFVEGPVQVVTELFGKVRAHVIFVHAGAGQEDGRCNGLCALDALRVVMGDHGGQLGRMEGLRQRLVQPSGGGHAHGAAVAVTAVGFRVVALQPLAEPSAVAAVRIVPAVDLHVQGHGNFNGLIVHAVGIHEGFRHGNGHNGVVRKVRALRNERKLRGLQVVLVKFIG